MNVSNFCREAEHELATLLGEIETIERTIEGLRAAARAPLPRAFAGHNPTNIRDEMQAQLRDLDRDKREKEDAVRLLRDLIARRCPPVQIRRDPQRRRR